MGKKGLFLFLFLFRFLALAENEKVALDKEPWLIYQVDRTHSLWRFAEHLNIKSQDIPRFIQEILYDNPRLRNPSLIYPGEKILVRGSVLYGFIPKKKSYTTYWANGLNTKINSTSKMYLPMKSDNEQNVLLLPSFGYERLRASQRGTGASVTLLSSAKVGLKSEYNWRNSLGSTGIGLGLDWVKFNENFGNQIQKNAWLSLQVEWFQQIQIFQTWKMNFSLGYFQAPYLFTDNSNNLSLKLGGQPGLGVGVIKDILSLNSQFGLKLTYFYFGYAGDTLIQDGISGKIDYNYAFGFFGQNLQLGLWVKYDQLLSEVTEQNRLATGLGLGVNW